MTKKRGGIPDRWLDYYPLGERVAGTRFIAFKVPLKEALCRGLHYQDWFTPRYLMEQVPQLGLVVDLTFTTRYYYPQEFKHEGLEYQKVLCPGHVIPPKDLVHRFYSLVDEYIKRNSNSETLIGVHCTHGLNRTAFFVCSYMIERMGMAPQEALTAFETARGHKVERENYIQELLLLKPLSAPSLVKPDALYPQQQMQPLPENRKRPAHDVPCVEKVRRQDNTFQRPTTVQYADSMQHRGNHHRSRDAFRGDSWNASNNREPQRYSRFVSEQLPSCDGSTSGSERKNNIPVVLQGRKLDGFSDGGQDVMTNGTGDPRIRHVQTIDKYRTYGNGAWAFKNDDNFSACGKKLDGYSRDDGRGRIRDHRDSGTSVNRINKFNSSSERSQFHSESSGSQNVRRHHPSLASTTQGHQSRRYYRSSNLPS